MDDVPEALRLIPFLENLPQSWTWKQAQQAMRAVAYVLRQGIDMNHVGQFLAFHHALEQNGIDEEYLVDLVTALEEAGVDGPRKRKVLDRLLAKGALQVDIEDLTQEAHGLAAEVERLKAWRDELRSGMEEEESRIEILREQGKVLHDQLDALAGKVAGYEQERTLLHAIRLLCESRADTGSVSSAEAQQSPHQGCNQQPGRAESTAPQDGQWLGQLFNILQPRCGQPNTGSETGRT